jgi:Tfp pilus assembly PilM family ATPase
MEMSEENLVAIEVAVRGNDLELMRYAIRALPLEGVNSAWFHFVWSQEHFAARQVIYVIPGSLIRYKDMIVPHLPPEQLADAVRFELENGVEGAGFIYQIIDSQPQQQMMAVKVAIIDNVQLNSQIQFLSQAGFEMLWSGIRTRGIQNFIALNQSFFAGDKEPVAFLDLTAGLTEYGVVNGEDLSFWRDFHPGYADLSGADQTGMIEEFEQELRLSMMAAVAAGEGGPLRQFWLFGKTKRLAELVPQAIKYQNVRLS